MKATIDKLNVELTEMVTSRKAFAKKVSRQDFKEYVGGILVGQRNLLGSLNELTGAVTGKSLATKMADVKGDKARLGVKAYFALKGKLDQQPLKNASKAETTPLASVQKALVENIAILEGIESNIDKFFTQSNIAILNCRLSHVVVLGVLAESKLLSTYTQYMISAVISDVVLKKPVAKYRYKFMDDKVQDMANIVARANAKTGSSNLKAMVNDLKKQNIDVSLIDDMNGIPVGSIDGRKISKSTNAVMARGIGGLSIFRILGEMWETYKLNREQAAKREHDWMKAHVAILMMDLEDLDVNSKEYKRLAKIIQAFEDMIAKEDRKQKGSQL